MCVNQMDILHCRYLPILTVTKTLLNMTLKYVKLHLINPRLCLFPFAICVNVRQNRADSKVKNKQVSLSCAVARSFIIATCVRARVSFEFAIFKAYAWFPDLSRNHVILQILCVAKRITHYYVNCALPCWLITCCPTFSCRLCCAICSFSPLSSSPSFRAPCPCCASSRDFSIFDLASSVSAVSFAALAPASRRAWSERHVPWRVLGRTY